MCRQVEVTTPSGVGEPTRQCNELATDGLGDERSGKFQPEGANPAHRVVGDRSEHGPGGVRVEVTRGTVLESRVFLQVSYREFHDGVTTVVGVECDGVTLAVGDEGVVVVGGEERGPGVTQLRAMHDESVTGVVGLAQQPIQNPVPLTRYDRPFRWRGESSRPR